MWDLIISLIVSLISYLLTKRGKSENNGKALAAAAVAGLGTSYLLDNTSWGQSSISWLNSNIANLDGVATSGTTPSATTNSAGQVVVGPSASGSTSTGKGSTSIWDTLNSWGPTGTAAVIGTTTVATNSNFSKWLPWIIGGGALILLTR